MRLRLLAVSALCVALVARPGTSDGEPSSIPVKQWLAHTSRVLAAATLNSPFTESERMWEALDQCVPDRPVEIRAIVKSVNWKNGVAKVTIGRPLGWPATPGRNPPAIFHESKFYVIATADQAALMQGSWFICEGKWCLLRDFREVLKEPDKRRMLARVSVGKGKAATSFPTICLSGYVARSFI